MGLMFPNALDPCPNLYRARAARIPIYLQCAPSEYENRVVAPLARRLLNHITCYVQYIHSSRKIHNALWLYNADDGCVARYLKIHQDFYVDCTRCTFPPAPSTTHRSANILFRHMCSTAKFDNYIQRALNGSRSFSKQFQTRICDDCAASNCYI